ncbi:MAG: NAD(P)/FAD-dependent oxidoreductase [Deltaproteobacteria bacterium]|nr:NAD(P)/FAD-dependent oxidoreductase [Deltaproteobacteria bacterium]
MNKEPVVIIGAGPAGLSAAYELVKRGVKPVILEKADKVGGIARTETYKGYLFDIGGHRFFTKNQKINRVWQKMLGKDFLKVPRMSRIYYHDRFFNYPLQLSNSLINLGVIQSFLILSSYVKSQLRPYSEEETFDQWVSNRFGRRLYTTFFKTYTEKVWGMPCHKIRADWAAQRIKGLSLITAVSNALLGVQEAKSFITEFDYPEKGPGMMWERFKDEVGTHGGDIKLNREVTGLRQENDSIISLTYTEAGKTVEIPVGQLISSTSITGLAALFDPKVPDDVSDAARQLRYRAFIIVILIVDKKNLFPDQWIYVHSPEVRVGRIQNFKNWSAAMVPDSEKTSVGMEYFCNEKDDIWMMSDADLTDLASEELSRLGLGNRDKVVDSHVVRQPNAYPVYDTGYLKHIDVIRNFLEKIENLQTIGRNGMHRYNNMDHSMLTGMFAAENVLGHNHDLWEINEDNEYLEEDKANRPVIERFLSRTFARMDKIAFASAVGVVSGVLIFFATIWLVIKGGDVVGPNLQLLSQYFVGYTVTVKGAFIAFGYSFFWGFFFGWLFAYLRNFLLAFFIYWVKKKTELLTLKDFFDHL